jgi:GntR family transcriptional regulator, rspAB operon transcriptional repressor
VSRVSAQDVDDGRGLEPLTTLALRRLREEILDGRVRPGERVVQDAVAKRYGMSRVPVREALRELASEGLVTIEPAVGARVAPLDRDDLDEIFLLREALEPLAVRDSAMNLGPEDLAMLRFLLDEGERCAAAGDIDGYLDFDRRFHQLVISACRLKRLKRMVEGLWNAARQYRILYLSTQPQRRVDTSVVQHRLLLECLEEGGADMAADITRIHIKRFWSELSKSRLLQRDVPSEPS